MLTIFLLCTEEGIFEWINGDNVRIILSFKASKIIILWLKMRKSFNLWEFFCACAITKETFLVAADIIWGYLMIVILKFIGRLRVMKVTGVLKISLAWNLEDIHCNGVFTIWIILCTLLLWSRVVFWIFLSR